jgi:hypothetical protein
MVQPVPLPLSLFIDEYLRMIENGSIQNLKLFKRGKIRSKFFPITGIIQFPPKPIILGITKKKIIKIAWAVTKLLNRMSPTKLPLLPSSIRIIPDSLTPVMQALREKRKYIALISL